MALTRKEKIIAVIFTVVLFGSIGGVIFYPILKAGPFWPDIDEPSRLLQDSKMLLREYPDFIEDVNWPVSVMALHPMAIYSNQDSIDIIISGGGIGPLSWGYLIYPDGRTNPNTSSDFIIKGPVCPGIFKYERKKKLGRSNRRIAQSSSKSKD